MSPAAVGNRKLNLKKVEAGLRRCADISDRQGMRKRLRGKFPF
jgi:hypothetical protein